MEVPKVIMVVDPPKHDKVILSAVVPCRGETWPVLAMTLQSIQEELLQVEKRGLGYTECIVVFNGPSFEHAEALDRFKKSPFRTIGNFRLCEAKQPGEWRARNAGLAVAVGEYVWMGDSHIICGHDLFVNLLNEWKGLLRQGHTPGLLHSGVGWLSGVHSHDLCFQYATTLRENFWGSYVPGSILERQKICMKGTSYMANTRFLQDIGGWNEHLNSYGGGEAYINLKVWRLGKSVWVTPDAYIWHLAYPRGYTWTNAGFWYNTLLAAYTVGDRFWLDHQAGNYRNYLLANHHGDDLIHYSQELEELISRVKMDGRADMRNIARTAKYSLSELIALHGWK